MPLGALLQPDLKSDRVLTVLQVDSTFRLVNGQVISPVTEVVLIKVNEECLVETYIVYGAFAELGAVLAEARAPT